MPDNHPPPNRADPAGGRTVEPSAGGEAAMGILGTVDRAAVDAGAAEGKRN
jgi:hypothetical protein